MSKIAKKPIEIAQGLTLTIENGNAKVVGPKGELNFKIPQGVAIKVENGVAQVSQSAQGNKEKALSGLVRATVANMLKGVSQGFEKKLELAGVGYRAQGSGNNLSVSVGFSHPVKIVADQSISFLVEENVITVSGIDKSLVGNTAAQIRDIRPPEPYKGKGIKYQGERIRRKVGKAAKAVGAK